MSITWIDNNAAQRGKPDEQELAQRVIEAVRGVRFGSVEIVIHEGRIVHIERRERMRLSLVGTPSLK